MVEEGKEIEIIEASAEVSPSPLSDDTLLTLAAQADARVDAVNKIKQVVLKVTNSNDWLDQNGKPYLWASGAEKIARVFGVSYRLEVPTKTNLEAGHYRWEYKGEFMLAGATIEAFGSRSSKDKFFSRSHGRDIPPSEIDEGNVKKAAYTNCIGNGITRLLGIRNLTWDELKAAGINPGNVGSKVDYGSNKEPATPAQLKKIQVLKKQGIEVGAFGEPDYYGTLRKKYKIEHSTDLSKQQATEFIDSLLKHIEENQPPAEPEQEELPT